VRARRSSADARHVYYSLDLTRLRELYLASVKRIHPSLGDLIAVAEKRSSSDPAGR
jgi:hypothetical protein